MIHSPLPSFPMPATATRLRHYSRSLRGVVLWLASLFWAGSVLAADPLPRPLSESVPEPLREFVTEPSEPSPALYIADPLNANGFAGIPSCIESDVPCWPRWFVGASGLVMTRTLPSGAATMQPVASGQQLSTSSASATWPGGIDFHVGRWMGPRQQHAIEAIYWGVYNMGSSGSISSAGNINAIPAAASTITVSGTTAASILTGAQSQQISRSDLVNDIEINWVYSLGDHPEFMPTEQRFNLMWLAGFRFFELQDTLSLATVSSSASQLNFNVATNNNLYGGQVGAKFDWRLAPRLRFSAVPKFLLAGNAITNTSSLASPSGTNATFADGSAVNVHATRGVFSWLGSVDSAVAWDVTDRWTLSMGYRVVGVGNIAQADGQWPALITNATSLMSLEAGSSTIIHGGFAGFEGRY